VELDQFSLGGLLNLSGYPKNYLFGSEIQFASVVYQYQFSESLFSLFNAPFYLGTSLERGLVRQSRFSALQNVPDTDWIWAGSVFAGWDSPLGPLYLGYGQAESDASERPYRFYLSLGQTF
jgi:NTE family protein